MDGGAWWAAVHGVAKSRARLSDFAFALSNFYSFYLHRLFFKKQFHINIDGAYCRPGAVLVQSRSVTEKVGLKLNIQKMKIMAFGLITSWQIDGETVETVRDFILGAPKSLQMVTAAMKLKDACSLEEK